MPAPKSNLTLVTRPTAETGESEFWLSDPEKMEDGDGDWGFAVYAQEDVWLATFTYATEDRAWKAREQLILVLQGAIFIATADS